MKMEPYELNYGYYGMGQFSLGTVLASLDAKKQLDPNAGIYVAKLEGLPLFLGEQDYFVYGAEIGTHVNPHVHLIGDELYVLLEGEGEMNIGSLQPDGSVIWNEPILLHSGVSGRDRFTVNEGVVHSLRNLSRRPLILQFAAPEDHLVDFSPATGKGDRRMIAHLPPHYK
jgi:mannose-6-phosphate isomerase-like protein (cupin superfamily)